MKAEFKKTKATDGLPLTIGKMYDVLDAKAGRRPWQIKEIKVKNDLGQEHWYGANKFNLFVEASAFLKEPAGSRCSTERNAGRGADDTGSGRNRQLKVSISQ